jgi:glyoxylase-like metal-dependent hydrolase (beta-lactamase superfamily II)
MALHRRHLLASLGAALAVPPRRAGAATPLFRRTVGAAEITVISDGALDVPMSFTLPETSPEDAKALLAAAGLAPGWPPIPTNVSLVKIGADTVLIDAGSGSNWQPTAGRLSDNMQAAGIDPASVTQVVFTHCHADHLWGAIDDFDDSERFPNARYVVPSAEWDFWTDPDTPTRVPAWLKGMVAGSARILKRLDARIERREPGDTVAPGMSYVDTIGHTPGHMSVLLESEGQHLLIGGDALSHVAVSFARPEWRMGSDYDRDRAVTLRRRLLDRLATERLALIGFHLPYPGHGMVERSGMAYRFVAA